jgi:hypothetical protein
MSGLPVKFGFRGSSRGVVRALDQDLIKDQFRPRLLYSQLVTVDDFVGAAALTQALNLNALFPKNVFPAGARGVDLLAGTTVENVVLPVGAGITSITIQLGDTFDPNGLLTASNLLGGGAAVGDVLSTPGAAEYANRFESAYSPECLITAIGANLSLLTAISFHVVIPWAPRGEIPS